MQAGYVNDWKAYIESQQMTEDEALDYLKKSWIFPTEFPTAQIGLITKGGDYVVQSQTMCSTNFLEFIRAYNYADDYNKMYELEDRLLATESRTLFYKDSKGQDCIFYYSRFGDDSNIDILGYIPVADTQTDSVDWTIILLICGTLLVLAVVDGLYFLAINRELKRTAEQASEAKTQFLSSMSHDIRTPMNAVIGVTEIAKQHLDDPMYVRHCLDKVSMAGNHLLTLINDILDISKVESGKMTLNEAPFSLGFFYCAVYYNTPAKILGEPPYLVPRGGGVRNAAGKFCPNVPFWC